MPRLGWFVFGVAVGAVGVTLLADPESRVLSRDALKRVVIAYDTLVQRVARAREDLEDLVEEARHEEEERVRMESPRAEATA